MARSNEVRLLMTRTRPIKKYVPASDFRAIVAHYRSVYRDESARELRFFRTQISFDEVIACAALAKRRDGKRHNHQRRIPRVALNESLERLMLVRPELKSAKTFAEIHSVVERTILSIYKIGELTVYDTALRIAAWRQLHPKVVYLHAGTREGARALGLNVRRPFIPVAELPAALRKLSAHEIEDVLCIYKDLFRGRRKLQSAVTCTPSNPSKRIC